MNCPVKRAEILFDLSEKVEQTQIIDSLCSFDALTADDSLKRKNFATKDCTQGSKLDCHTGPDQANDVDLNFLRADYF